jgi:glycosyltransferase involved in cell wall biosynthesis
VAVSQYTRGCLLKFFHIKSSKIEVIYNGIDYDLFNPIKANGLKIQKKLNLENLFVYMYFGRPGFTKGIEYLIRAVPLILEKIPNSKLLLILANDPKDRYESIVKMISDLDIKDKIILQDPVPRKELPNYIAATDCVVVPSLSEGFGFTAAESCAMEKPVVATDVGSLPEVVSGRYVVVEPRNPEAIAEGVEKVYKSEIEDKGKNMFSWNKCVEKYLEVYQEILE